MPGSNDAIRADLARRLTAIRPHARPAEVARALGEVRAIALRNGFAPAATVALLVDQALARGEGGALVHGWMPILRDAVASDRHDPAACAAFAGACSVRLSD